MLVVLFYHSLLICRVEMHEFPQKFPERTRGLPLISATVAVAITIVIHAEHLYIKLEIRDYVFNLAILKANDDSPIYPAGSI